MDDEDLFGPVAYHLNLSDAIDLGLLADYQILVPVVTDTDLRDWLATGAGAGIDGLRLAGRQVSPCAPSTTIPATPHPHLPPPRRRRSRLRHHPDRHCRHPPHRTAARGGCGRTGSAAATHPQVRRRLLLEFTSHQPRHPRRPFERPRPGEGIDVPDIDAVVFADPKNSPVDTVQAVGRALRQHPGAGKKATLVVPVCTSPRRRPDDLLSADAYTPLWRTIQALRAHDDRLDARLRSDPAPTAPPCPAKTPKPGSASTAPPRPKKSPSPSPARPGPQERRKPRPRLAAAAATATPTATSTSPRPTKTPPATPLGRWLTWQRHLTPGTLDAVRVHALERLGIIWDPPPAGLRPRTGPRRRLLLRPPRPPRRTRRGRP
ncbi:helicase-related protein [Streptomyces noursei]|uniref:helicase-related protein n=1 Tax=Streptomyces noursei TaxID=1971 RepID=UPI0021A38B5E|nr:helicase-related protein [Streptomyces noursei]UWS77514.1 hypothetical protein N1H47_00040 [Streptomyces noursei]UWS77534.1 hypothetical protein N1H47_40480 [Streptomyces noursei]